MSTENMFAVLQGDQAGDVTQPIAHGDQGNAWVAQVNGDAVAPPPPLPMPEATTPVLTPDVATPPPPPAMPEAAAPATTMAAPATTAAAPAEKSTGGWEVDPYRIRAFGDAVLRARSYLDAVRMKVDRMQGAELTPQLGTSPVGQQLSKKFDDRLNAEAGLRAMLTEAMTRMERFVTTAEEASRAYETSEQNAVENAEKFKYEVEWADEPWDDEYDQGGHGHGGHGDNDHGHGQDEKPEDDQAEDRDDDRDQDDRDQDQDEDGRDGPAQDKGQDDRGQDRGDDGGGDRGDQDDRAQGQDGQGQDDRDHGQDRDQDDRAEDDRAEGHEDRGQDDEPGERQDEKPAGHGRGKPG